MKRMYSGYYTANLPIKLTKNGVTKDVTAELIVERRDRGDCIGNYPWTWKLTVEDESFHEYDEDGGYATKKELLDMIERGTVLHWTWNGSPLNCWCI